MMRKIFDRKKRKPAIQWESIFSQLPASVYWKDKFGFYLGCNLPFAELLGLQSEKEIIGKTDAQLPWDKKTCAEMIDSDKTVLRRKKRIVTEKFNRYVMKMPLTNTRGEVVGVFGISFDVTQYKGEMEREWRTLDEIIAVMPGHVYWKDRHCILRGGNELQATDVGFESRKMLIGKTAHDLLTADQLDVEKQAQAELIKSYDEEVMNNDKSLTIEERIVRPDKSVATYLSKRTPLHDEFGQVTGLVGISFDITDRKKSEEDLMIAKEQAEAANRAKTEFLENIRHDIRTPLTGIVGFARLIQKEAISEKTKGYADQLVAATTALLDFQNEILDAIKVTTGFVPIGNQTFHLKTLVEKVIALIKPKAIIKGLSIALEYDETLPVYVRGDSKRLFRILLELTTNALKFTSKGEIQISLIPEKIIDSRFILRCVISDTGIGIAPENQENVFVRFARVSPSSDGVYEGTGLGLTIVKQFVEDLGGKIYLNSRLGKGSTLVCMIPFEIGEAADIPNAENKSATVNIQDKKAAILLVEDHEMTATVTKLMLEEINCDVDIVYDAQNTLIQCDKKQYDLILMDLGLPDSNGFLVSEEIRQSKSMNQKTPIIALTAHIEVDDQDHYLAYGMNAIFQKPLLKSNAVNILNTYISKGKNIVSTIDLKLGAKRINKDEAAAKEMLILLAKNIDHDMTKVTNAYQARDFDKMHDAVHKILGGLSYCGAPSLEKACLEFQSSIKNNDFTKTELCYQKVLSEVEILKTTCL